MLLVGPDEEKDEEELFTTPPVIDACLDMKPPPTTDEVGIAAAAEGVHEVVALADTGDPAVKTGALGREGVVGCCCFCDELAPDFEADPPVLSWEKGMQRAERKPGSEKKMSNSLSLLPDPSQDIVFSANASASHEANPINNMGPSHRC